MGIVQRIYLLSIKPCLLYTSSLDPISGQGTLAQSALSLCRRAQTHYSIKERLSRLAWSSLVAAVDPIIQGYGSIPKTLDQLAINNRAPK